MTICEGQFILKFDKDLGIILAYSTLISLFIDYNKT